MVTGFPDVKLTPYIGAVVLNVDLHNRAGVLDSQVLFSSDTLTLLSGLTVVVDVDVVVVVVVVVKFDGFSVKIKVDFKRKFSQRISSLLPLSL